MSGHSQEALAIHLVVPQLPEALLEPGSRIEGSWLGLTSAQVEDVQAKNLLLVTSLCPLPLSSQRLRHCFVGWGTCLQPLHCSGVGNCKFVDGCFALGAQLQDYAALGSPFKAPSPELSPLFPMASLSLAALICSPLLTEVSGCLAP